MPRSAVTLCSVSGAVGRSRKPSGWPTPSPPPWATPGPRTGRAAPTARHGDRIAGYLGSLLMATGSATGALVRERGIVVNGLRSPVLEAGPPAGEEAVFFVHGNPGSSEDWRGLVGLAGVFTRAIALDMPG